MKKNGHTEECLDITVDWNSYSQRQQDYKILTNNKKMTRRNLRKFDLFYFLTRL